MIMLTITLLNFIVQNSGLPVIMSCIVPTGNSIILYLWVTRRPKISVGISPQSHHNYIVIHNYIIHNIYYG